MLKVREAVSKRRKKKRTIVSLSASVSYFLDHGSMIIEKKKREEMFQRCENRDNLLNNQSIFHQVDRISNRLSDFGFYSFDSIPFLLLLNRLNPFHSLWKVREDNKWFEIPFPKSKSD